MNTKRSKRWKEPLFALGFLLTAALLLTFTGLLLRPAHTDYGSTWKAFLQEPEDSIDILYLGSSYAYCDWNPGVIYDQTGLTGYVMGGSEQTPALTYWYLREALRTQSPSAVVMEGTSLLFERYQNYTQINVGYMPWGWNRVGAILDASEPEKRMGLFFDLYFYHDRWKDINYDDIQQALTAVQADDLKGYTVLNTYETLEGGPWLNEMSISEEVYRDNLDDFARIADLCRAEELPLIVVINPKYSRFTPAVYDRMEKDLADIAPEVIFLNWADQLEETGLDTARHFYDAGHMNREGATILSTRMGQWLVEQGFTPRPQPEENAAAWRSTAAYWREYAVELSEG